jgi:hypothetical protein
MIIGRAKIAAVSALNERRPPLARIVASAFALDFHDVGTKVCEQLPAPWASQNAG